MTTSIGSRRLLAEFIGTAALLATVIGSGIMAERLAGGNDAVALLGNTIATGAMLVVLITIFGPVSGAHFNPAVTIAFLLRREIEKREALIFIVVQVLGGCARHAHCSRHVRRTDFTDIQQTPQRPGTDVLGSGRDIWPGADDFRCHPTQAR